MARKKRKRASYRRIDLRERKAIEHALDRGTSCRSIARDLGRSASTIHDEVVRWNGYNEWDSLKRDKETGERKSRNGRPQAPQEVQ
ncbi:MAG: helix-turn-helix domain-containing protein [Atopobiaceae bacterium]|nr:helix-turn-helix domain-containing protein [Atopobiaceae bacterium]